MKFEVVGAGSLELDFSRLVLVKCMPGKTVSAIAHAFSRTNEEPARSARPLTISDVCPDRLCQCLSIYKRLDRTPGNAAAVLLFHSGKAYVTVGSDYSDHDPEIAPTGLAKAVVPKVVARQCWTLASVRNVWDQLSLASNVEIDGSWRAWQTTSLSEMINPEWLERFNDGTDTAVFCAVPRPEAETQADAFRVQLHNPADGTEITCWHRIVVQQ